MLADTGPLVALFDADDRDHERAVGFVREFQGTMGTTWPVVTEVTRLLDFSVGKQLEFLEWVERGRDCGGHPRIRGPCPGWHADEKVRRCAHGLRRRDAGPGCGQNPYAAGVDAGR